MIVTSIHNKQKEKKNNCKFHFVDYVWSELRDWFLWKGSISTFSQPFTVPFRSNLWSLKCLSELSARRQLIDIFPHDLILPPRKMNTNICNSLHVRKCYIVFNINFSIYVLVTSLGKAYSLLLYFFFFSFQFPIVNVFFSIFLNTLRERRSHTHEKHHIV